MIRSLLGKIVPVKMKRILWRSWYFILANTALYKKKVNQVTLETTNACNIRCALCPIPMTKRKKGFMSMDDFKTIISKLPRSVRTLRMNYAGEPLLNKDIFKMTKYLKENRPDIWIRISTNGTVLKRFDPAEIISSGTNQIDICIEGASKETHEMYRVGSNFEEICNAARVLCETKQKMKVKYPAIVQLTLLNKNNIAEISKLEEQAREIGFDELHLRYMQIPTLNCETEELQKSIFGYFSQDERKGWREKFIAPLEYSQYEIVKGQYRLREEMKRCYSFIAPFILWNGDVSVCCQDAEGICVIGNLLRESFPEVISRMPSKKIYYKKLPICNSSCDISYLGKNHREIKLKG